MSAVSTENGNYNVIFFGVVKDITGSPGCNIYGHFNNVGELRAYFYDLFPDLKKLNSMMVAVNKEYAEDAVAILHSDEIALIPPVSGG